MASLNQLVGNLRFVIDDGVDCISEVVLLHEVQVYGDCSSLCLNMHHVVWLVGEHGNSHHGNAVVDGLKYPVCSAMGDESSGLWVT